MPNTNTIKGEYIISKGQMESMGIAVNAFAKGGIISGNKNGYISIQRGYPMTFTNEKGDVIAVEVQPDGTIHVDPSAFQMMMEQMGFERAGTF